MAKHFGSDLSRRERQIMDIIYERRRATAVEVMEALPNAPSYSSVRTLLRILEMKGHLKHQKEGVRYIYMATHPRQSAARSALKQVLRTFFDGSVEKAVAALLSDSDVQISDAEFERLAAMIEQEKEKGG
ncbi:MAG TPA: BlaI/MecI/CopY family transcriptional regulator [Chthonomonadaceae bacterium]|nr:BlaI/MecI/CopY family transcriptional regulator [Chthonomonadaceae bacterium]